jgi:hypothetical protein
MIDGLKLPGGTNSCDHLSRFGRWILPNMAKLIQPGKNGRISLYGYVQKRRILNRGEAQ